MNPTKRMCDLLGRTKKLQLAVLKLLAALLVIPGSAWPSQARSMGASYDSMRDCYPFALSAAVMHKLELVHEVVTSSALGEHS